MNCEKPVAERAGRALTGLTPNGERCWTSQQWRPLRELAFKSYWRLAKVSWPLPTQE
jgi:hypothetical protein